MPQDTINRCFGCGPDNPAGLGLVFDIQTSDAGELTAVATVELGREYDGGAGCLHGGIVATLMDEAMSKLNRPLGGHAMTRQLEVQYLLPSPSNTRLILTGRHVRREGRKLFHAAELRDSSGRVLATATGFFLMVPRP